MQGPRSHAPRPLTAAVLTLGLAATLATACGSKDAPAPTASGTNPSAASSTSNPAAADAAAEPANGLTEIAHVGTRTITADDLRAALQARRGADPAEVLNDLIDATLLAAEARTAGFQATPASADAAVAAEWSRHQFLETARTSVTDADLAVWFAERRAANRLVVQTEAQATELAQTLASALKADPDHAVRIFEDIRAKSGLQEPTSSPAGAMFDAQGRNEVGVAIVPLPVAKATFALDADGAVSGPVALAADRFALVQRVGLRPGLDLASAPEEAREHARDAIATKRALEASQAHVAKLRAATAVSIDAAALDALRSSVGASARARKLPLDLRKLRRDQLLGKQVRVPGVMEHAEELRKATPQELLKTPPAPKENTP